MKRGIFISGNYFASATEAAKSVGKTVQTILNWANKEINNCTFAEKEQAKVAQQVSQPKPKVVRQNAAEKACRNIAGESLKNATCIEYLTIYRYDSGRIETKENINTLNPSKGEIGDEIYLVDGTKVPVSLAKMTICLDNGHISRTITHQFIPGDPDYSFERKKIRESIDSMGSPIMLKHMKAVEKYECAGHRYITMSRLSEEAVKNIFNKVLMYGGLQNYNKKCNTYYIIKDVVGDTSKVTRQELDEVKKELKYVRQQMANYCKKIKIV